MSFRQRAYRQNPSTSQQGLSFELSGLCFWRLVQFVSPTKKSSSLLEGRRWSRVPSCTHIWGLDLANVARRSGYLDRLRPFEGREREFPDPLHRRKTLVQSWQSAALCPQL